MSAITNRTIFRLRQIALPLLVLLLLCNGGGAQQAAVGERVTVKLAGGAEVTATLLRRNEDGVVLDLGSTVITVDAKRVLDIHDRNDQSLTKSKQHQFYTVGRLKESPVTTHVKRFGDAIVTISTPLGLGSGFFISKDGHIITNYHVIEKTLEVQVTVFQRSPQGYEKKQFSRVKILAINPLRDLALLKLESEQMQSLEIEPVVISRDADLGVGDLVFAIGNPLGLERSVTQGIVSSMTRTYGHLRFIQTDASINPGNSGGPMFNSRGEVVGVVCAGFSFFQGLALGIPASHVIEFLEHRDAYLFDTAQPQNGIKYLQPPFRNPQQEKLQETTPDEVTAGP